MKTNLSSEQNENINQYIVNNMFKELMAFLEKNSTEFSKSSSVVLLYELLKRQSSLENNKFFDRYYNATTIDDIIEPVLLIKDLLHRFEFVDQSEKDNILQFMSMAQIGAQELIWMIEMFCLDKMGVLDNLK